MNNIEEPTSIIFWNTLYRANPEDQLEYLSSLQESSESDGVGRVLFCLSEVTSNQDGNGLRQLLENDGLDVEYAPTSRINKSTFEGLAIAAPEGVLESVDFTELTSKRGIRNTKTRYLGRAVLKGDGMVVSSAHLSYPAPSKEEIQGVIKDEGHVFGGDLNTVTSKKIVSELESHGMKKVSQGATFPIGFMGVELDHVFVDEELVDSSSAQLADKGPSNHRPIILTIR